MDPCRENETAVVGDTGRKGIPALARRALSGAFTRARETSMNPGSILAISGSLRTRSSNTEVLRAAALLAPASVRITLYGGLGQLPHFNPDLDVENTEAPAPVQELRSRVAEADGLIISSPEYAHGVPGTLKNALDWLVSGPEILYKPIGLVSASERATHAQAALAETLRTMSTVLVTGASLALPLGGRRLDAAEIAADPDLAAQLRSALEALAGACGEYRARRASLFGTSANASEGHA
jgi:chromate reductase